MLTTCNTEIRRRFRAGRAISGLSIPEFHNYRSEKKKVEIAIWESTYQSQLTPFYATDKWRLTRTVGIASRHTTCPCEHQDAGTSGQCERQRRIAFGAV